MAAEGAAWLIEIVRDSAADANYPWDLAIVWRIHRETPEIGGFERWYIGHPNPGGAQIPAHLIDAAQCLHQSVIADWAGPTKQTTDQGSQQLSLL
jgi:hypothetical protein